MNTPLFQAQNLYKAYQGTPVIQDFSFAINPGEVVGLLGPNGAGKTTLFYLTIGLLRPDSGTMTFEGQQIDQLSMDQRIRLGMGYLAQEPSVFRQMTVAENVLCILETLPLSHPKRTERLNQLLSELHLDKLADQRAALLSGGERRRLEITRALVRDPQLLLLDEPFANIDPLAIYDVKHMITLLKSKGISILVTDHNAKELASIVDRAYLIQGGQLTASGTMEDILNNPHARTSYFGEGFTI